MDVVGVAFGEAASEGERMVEVFTVPHVFPPESGGFRGIPGIPGESDLAVGPAKLEFSIPGHSGGMQPGIGSFPEWRQELRNGIDSRNRPERNPREFVYFLLD